MEYEAECSNCEVKFEIKVKDYVLGNGDPDIVYCPNCGKATLE